MNHDEVQLEIKAISSQAMGKLSIRCNYDLARSPEYDAFMEQVGHRPFMMKSFPSASPRVYFSLANNINPDKYDGIFMFIFYRRNMITQAKGLEQADVQLVTIQNFTQVPKLTMEMVKYQSTSDIFGLSFSGKRND